MPLLRLQFIFLRKEPFVTRAKRVVRDQPEPVLMNSYKAHLKAINSIVYIYLPKIVITASHDCSCRLWTLGGRYLGTFGTPLPWNKLSPFVPSDESKEYRIPPDIKKVASSTTMKVVSGRQADRQRIFSEANKDEDSDEMQEVEDFTREFGATLTEPILGKHFELPGKSALEQRVTLDTTLSYIPVYSHLKIHEVEPIRSTVVPPAIRRISAEKYMDEYLRDTTVNSPEMDEINVIKPTHRNKPILAAPTSHERLQSISKRENSDSSHSSYSQR